MNRSLVGAVVMVSIGCGSSAQPVPEPAPPPAEVPGPGPTLPEEDEVPGPTRAEQVTAYAADCHATFTATSWLEDEPQEVDECRARTVEQNCVPDPFRCMAVLDSCQLGCAPTCGGCQGRCADACDACKAGCAPGDAACATRCAEARADCRGGCVTALRTCTGETCVAAMQACHDDKAGRMLKECDRGACEAAYACVLDDDAGDLDKVIARCGKSERLSPFCADACGRAGAQPIVMLLDNVALAADETLAEACTEAAQCPEDYATVAPYLARFCAGALTDPELAALGEEVRQERLSERSLALVFNAHGAMYGYTFKKETWMNAFFYGQGEWLPPACKAKVKAFVNAAAVPSELTRLRDRVKAVWSTVR